MHPLAHIDLAHARDRDIERSFKARDTRTAPAVETPRILEPVTRDTFIDALGNSSAHRHEIEAARS